MKTFSTIGWSNKEVDVSCGSSPRVYQRQHQRQICWYCSRKVLDMQLVAISHVPIFLFCCTMHAPYMFNGLLGTLARISCKETEKFFFTFLTGDERYSLQTSVWPDSVVKNVLCNICKMTFGLDLCKRYFRSFWWKWTLKFTRFLSSTVFCLVGFHAGFGSQGANISRSGWFSLCNASLSDFQIYL